MKKSLEKLVGFRAKYPLWVIFLVAISLVSCVTQQSDTRYDSANQVPSDITLDDLHSIIRNDQLGGAVSEKEITQMFNWLIQGDYQNASLWVNNALRMNISSSALQFLNGLTYHMQSSSDVSKRDLARKGYELAVKFDPSNWLAHYYMGLLELDSRNYKRALSYLAEAAMFDPDKPDLLNALGKAAYYSRKPDIAAGVFGQLVQENPDNEEYKYNHAMSLAALGLTEDAQKLSEEVGDNQQRTYLLERISDWKDYYSRNLPQGVQNAEQPLSDLSLDPSKTALNSEELATAKLVKTQMGMGYPPSSTEESNDATHEDYPTAEADGAKGSAPAPSTVDSSNKMVILDVVIIRTVESTKVSNGVNLLEGLRIQFTRSIVDSTIETVDPTFTQSNISHSITDGIDARSLEYSLNIANTRSVRNEILARPSLIATDGQTSRFFSGINIVAAAVGGGSDFGGGATINVERDIGVSLQVSPKFLNNGQVKLNISAERTFLANPNTSAITFDLRIDTSKTEVSADVVMNMGETLILSGLSEKETELIRDGVPFLQDIPIIQYAFSNKTALDFQRSVLILVTPRAPNYIYKEKNADGSYSRVSEFQSHYSDWFSPYPNWASVFNHFESNQLYREFRTGDVTLETWSSKLSLKARLLDALKSLYF